MIFLIGSGGGGSPAAAGSWTFGLATALPATVADSTILAIVADATVNYYLADEAPATPSTGDVWFHCTDPEAERMMTNGSNDFYCWGAYQWSGTAWVLLTTYKSFLGSWAELPGLPPVGTSFNDCSWEQIDRIGAAGKEAEYFTVGETKTVTLTTSESIQFRIVGMRHDLLADGSGQYAPLSLHMVDCLQTTGPMEGSNINTNGWNGCVMRNTCNTTYYGMLPAALKAVVKPVQKRASVGNQPATIVTSLDKVWLAAEVEIFGVITHSATGEGSQYAYYTNSSVRIKNVAGAASFWWQRSPNAGTKVYFCNVSGSGTAGYGDNASVSYGVALGLCV